MATVYGSTISSTFRSYLTYTVTETATNYTITVNDVGFDQVSSTYIYEGPESDGDNTLSYTINLGSNTYKVYDSNVGYEQDTSLIDNFSSYDRSLTIAKTTSSQSVTVSFSFYTAKWFKSNINTGIGSVAAAATSTASVTLTVPAISKPTITLTALRDSNVETTVTFKATVSSFSSDIISSVNLIVNGTTYSMGSGTVGSSGGLTFSKTITGLSIGRISASLVATGKGGSSDTYVLNVPSAFYTLDIGNKGKEIAFGQSATTSESSIPSNGLFSCGMDICIVLGNCTITDSGTALSVTSGASTLDGLVAQSIIDTFSYADAKEILEM